MIPSAPLQSDHFLDISYFIRLTLTLRPSDVLALRGFPSELQNVDYDGRTIHTQAFAVDGRYVGPGESKHCGIVRFEDLEKNASLDGLSGSPVFRFEKTRTGLGFLFAGVLIQGTKTSGLGRFIHASVVFKALQLLESKSAQGDHP